ncbi:MAG: single-stranded DNA-binding protein [Bdellovibrionaceae bacterium]|nr:single-stranded DNA-binding protein [Pseudobdellovibrionaceae bacterium]
MKTMNRVFLMGNLGQKPELRQSKNGKPYTRLSVATAAIAARTKRKPPTGTRYSFSEMRPNAVCSGFTPERWCLWRAL